METRSTGIPGFDEILGGGIIVPSTILIAGNPGSGRTTMGIQSLCQAAKSGEKVLYICITTKSESSVRENLSNYDFYEEALNIHTFSISSVERDPLTMLVELGNYVASLKPDRILIDPVTPIGFAFAEAERRRFMYSLQAAIGEWNAIVYLTGTMSQSEVCRSVISDMVEGIVYLSQDIQRRENQRVIKIMRMNRPDYLEGEHTFDISNKGIIIYPRMTSKDIEEATAIERIELGIKGFEELTRGGLFKRSSTLIAGNTGTGKTLFGLHFIIHGARNGEPGLISSFEDSPAEIRHYAASVGLGLEELEQEGMIKIIYTAPSDINAGRHANELKKSITEIGAKRIVLDDISGFDYAFVDTVTKNEHMASLVRLFKKMGITSILISGNGTAASNVLTSEIPLCPQADVLIVLKNVEMDKQIKKTMSILKMHGSDHEKRILLYDIDSEGIHIGDFLMDQ